MHFQDGSMCCSADEIKCRKKGEKLERKEAIK